MTMIRDATNTIGEPTVMVTGLAKQSIQINKFTEHSGTSLEMQCPTHHKLQKRNSDSSNNSHYNKLHFFLFLL